MPQNSLSERYLLFDEDYAFPLDEHRQPLLVAAPAGTIGPLIRLSDGVFAARLLGMNAKQFSSQVGDARTHATDPVVARAVALLRAQERIVFDPADGSQLTWSDTGTIARGRSEQPVFPRIDPAVIGLIQNADGSKILLAEHAKRPGYFSCVAGYVEAGESIEDAWRREVWEETGRRVYDIAYVGSQPWSMTGALMLGFASRTDDVAPVAETDGELASTRWVQRQALASLPLAPAGSLARTMIDRWARGEFEGG